MHFYTQKNNVGFGYDVFAAHHKCTQATKVESLFFHELQKINQR
jgi:hypothetical protein